MNSEITSELASFHDFVAFQLKSGRTDISPEQALALWREREETLASVRRGLADVEAGRTRPADEALRELREELGSR